MRPVALLGLALTWPGAALLSQAPAGIRDITWKLGKPLRYPVKYHAYGVIGDRILNACGTQVPGAGNEHWSKRAWFFDPATGAYEDLPDAPMIAGKTVGAVAGDALYVVGGTTVIGDRFLFTRQVWRLSREGGAWKWREMPPLPFARIFGSVAVANDKLVILGGRAVYYPADPKALTFKGGDGYEINTVQCLDLQAPEKGWYDLPQIPRMARSGHAVAALGNKIYLFGGACYHAWTHGYPLAFLDDAYVLDVDTLRWREIRSLPAPLWTPSAAAYGDHEILVLGGHRRERAKERRVPQDEFYELYRAPEAPNLDVLVYDTDLDSYRTLPTPLPGFPITESTRKELGAMRVRNPPHDWSSRFDFSRGGRRVRPGVIVLGGTVYIVGSSVDITEANATDELWIGTVAR